MIVDLEHIKQKLLLKKAQILEQQPQVACLAFWDFDGTIIDGDISEGKKNETRLGAYKGMIDRSIVAGLVENYEASEEGVAAFWMDYRGDLESYYYLGGLFSNLSNEKKTLIHRLTQSTYSEVKKHFFDFSVSLLNFLHHEHIVSYVISASPQIFVEEACEHLPIQRQHIFGINLDEKDGQRLDPIFNYREGKKDRAQSLLATYENNAFPLLAVGNDWRADGHMLRLVLEAGGFGILINALHDEAKFQHESLFRLQIR